MRSLLIILFMLPLVAIGQTDKEKEEGNAKPDTCITKQMPQFPGGDEALIKYLAKNIHYPAEARDCGCSGTAYISFIINEEGKVERPTVLRHIRGCTGYIYIDDNGKIKPTPFKNSREMPCSDTQKLMENEAIRVIKSMPNWTPGLCNGYPVKVQYNLPVKFSLK